MGVSKPWVLPHELTNIGIHIGPHGTPDKSWLVVCIHNIFILGLILGGEELEELILEEGSVFDNDLL